MPRVSLQAEEREVFGKKLKRVRKDGFVPANVFGKGLESEAVLVNGKLFRKIYDEVGETGVVDLKVGAEKVKPVMVRDIQYGAVKGELLHVDFYQVDLNKPVTVYVPIKLIGEEDEKIHLGEAVVINPVSEIEVEALPGDLVDEIEVDISGLHEIDDTVTVGQLNVDREKIKILTPEEEVVVKMAPAVTEEMQKLMEEQEAEAVAAAEAVEEVAEGAGEVPAEGEPASAEATVGKEGGEGEAIGDTEQSVEPEEQ